MNRKFRIAVLLLAAALAAAACQKKSQVKGVELTVSFAESALTDNLITDVTYRWKTGKNFKRLDRDLTVFVHFWHDSNLIVQDDFLPDIPTTKWEPNTEYAFKRRLFIPKFIDEFDPQFKGDETLRLSAGFSNPFDRTGHAEREVLSKKLKILPPPLGTPEVIYESGWYDQEVNQDSPLKQWRWTAREAKCIVDNPKRDALLVIKGAPYLSVVKDQKLSFKINDTLVDEFVANQDFFEKSYAIKKEQLGDKDEFVLTISVDKPFIPAKVIPNSKDDRELGVQISFIYFR